MLVHLQINGLWSILKVRSKCSFFGHVNGSDACELHPITHILVNKDNGEVEGGTLEQMIKTLCVPVTDPNYVEALLLGHTIIVKSTIFLHKLIDVYENGSGLFYDEVPKFKSTVINVLVKWIKLEYVCGYFFDCRSMDHVCIKQLKSFARKLRSGEGIERKYGKTLKAALAEYKKVDFNQPDVPKPEPINLKALQVPLIAKANDRKISLICII